jgi:hypothetical protein
VYADLLLRWMHILSAAVLVGGTLFMRFAYLTDSPSKELEQYQALMRSRWAKCVAAASGFLILSGFVNLVRILGDYEIDASQFPGSVYHMVFGIKFLLAFVVFFLASALAGRRNLAQQLRKNEKFWLTINAVLAVAVVCLAGIMKMADRTPKAPASGDSSSAVVVRSANRTR